MPQGVPQGVGQQAPYQAFYADGAETRFRVVDLEAPEEELVLEPIDVPLGPALQRRGPASLEPRPRQSTAVTWERSPIRRRD